MEMTETILRKIKPSDKHELHSDENTKGLYLKVYISGRRSWLYRSRKGSAWRVVTLGTYPAMNLAKARQQALAMGEDAIPDAMTFGQLLDRWYESQIEPHYKVTKNIETYVDRGKQWLGNVQLSALKTSALVSKLQAYAKVSPVASNRCLSNWKLCLDYGVQVGAIESNPLARSTSKVAGGKEATRNRTLTDDEIRALWASDEPLLRFLLLTGLRISEGQQGRQDGSKWVCDTTKNGLPHWVHLPPLAVEQIAPWTTSLTAIQSKLKRWNKREGNERFTPHDLRRTSPLPA